MPTLNGLACAIDVQNASTVWPERVRPLQSVIVTEIITGIRRPARSNSSSQAMIAALVLSVSVIVSNQEHVRAAVDEATDLLAIRVAHLVERHRAR